MVKCTQEDLCRSMARMISLWSSANFKSMDTHLILLYRALVNWVRTDEICVERADGVPITQQPALEGITLNDAWNNLKDWRTTVDDCFKKKPTADDTGIEDFVIEWGQKIAFVMMFCGLGGGIWILVQVRGTVNLHCPMQAC